MEYPEIYEIRYTDTADNKVKTYGETTLDRELAIFTRDKLRAQGYKLPHIQYTFELGGQIHLLQNVDNVQLGFRPEFLNTPILLGRDIEISMPNGEKRKSKFAIVEAENILASHNEINFSSTIGYPTINGENINDRNYKDDKNAQAKVFEVAQNLDPNILVSSSRTPSGTPVITKDGIVVSGNNRTMSIKLAIDQFPAQYEEYKTFLGAEAFVFGFDTFIGIALRMGDLIPLPGSSFHNPLSVKFKNPVLVRIDYDFPAYNTTELSKYNKETKKSERPIDKAIKIGKMLLQSPYRNLISNLVGEYETFSQFYANFADQKKLRDILTDANIISKNDFAQYFDERGFNESGKELIENLLAGMVLSKDALIAGSMAGGRQFKNVVITSLPVLAKNASLGEFSLIELLNKAFLLEKKIHDSGLNFEDYVVQGNMFDEAPGRDELIMNRLLSEGRNKFKFSIDGYNNSVIDNENASLFGEKPTKQEIFDTYITNKINPETIALINKSTELVETEEKNAIPKFLEGQHVKYTAGDIDIETWYGIIKKVIPTTKEVLYRIDAFNVDYKQMDKEVTNEKYEVQLRPITKEIYNTHLKEWDKKHSEPVQKINKEKVPAAFTPQNGTINVPFKHVDTAGLELYKGNVEIIIPKGVRPEFVNNTWYNDKSKDWSKDQLARIKIFGEATPAENYELLQLSHPSEYIVKRSKSDYIGKLSRDRMLAFWDEYGENMTKALGLPTESNYPYININTGIVETISQQIKEEGEQSDENIEWWSLHQNFVAIAPNDIEPFNKRLQTLKNELIKEKATVKKSEKRSYDWAINSIELYQKVLSEYILNKDKPMKPKTVKASFPDGTKWDMPIETAEKVVNIQNIIKSEAAKKQNSMKNLIGDNYYKQNPDKVLGEPYQTSGRFGEVTKYRGKIEAVNRIDAPLNFMQLNIAENPTISFENESIQELLAKPESKQDLDTILLSTKKESIIKQIKKNTKVTTRIVASAPLSTADMYSFEEVYAQNNKDISKDELQVFVWYKEQIGQPLSPKWYALADYTSNTFTKEWIEKGLLYHYRNELIPAYLYFSGNIWEKRTAVDNEKKTIVKLYGEKVYENQLNSLQNVFKISYDKRLTLQDTNVANRLKLLPISKFSNQFMVKTLVDEKEFKMKAQSNSGKHPGRPDFLYAGHISDYKKTKYSELSLTEAFQYWLIEYKNEYEIKKGDITYAEIITVYINQRSRPGISDDAPADKKKEHEALWQRKVNVTKEEGDRLFSIFLDKWLDGNDVIKVETIWNERYNGFLPINHNKIPVAFAHAKEYTNAIVDIRPEKREAVSFLMNEGSECLAYDVGVGKTWSALFSIKQFLDAGYCKRPFIVVPNQVYKQFLAEGKGLLPDVKFNDLYNLTSDYIDDLRGPDGKIEMLPEGSISVITYEGFEKIGFSQSTADDILVELGNILDQNPDAPPDFSKKGQKKEAAIVERLKSLVGRGLRGTMIDIEDLGFDFFCADEAHKMKKLFVSVKGEAKTGGAKGEREKSPYQIQSGGEASSIALKGFMISQYILKNNNNRNVLTLTATPFTNSPLEIFSVLAFLAYGKLKEMGLNNLKTFFDTYVHATNELTINAKLKPERKQVVLGFNNLKSLQQLIARFINYKTGESVKVKRPNKYVLPFRSVTINEEVIVASPEERIDTNLPLSPQQEVMMKDIRDYAEGKRTLDVICAVPEVSKSDISTDDEDTVDETEGVELDEDSLSLEEKAGVRVLRAMSFARNLALSPYLYSCSGLGTNPTAKQYIETSPKLKYVMGCIKSVKEYHEKAGTSVSGQVIYMDRGVEYFGLLKQYLVEELGYKEHEVGIIKSQMKGGKDAKEMVKNFFLGQKYDEVTGELVDISEDQRMKIVIGSSTIKEGINLQRHSTVLHNCFLDFNPTDIKQLEGRIWRQGNLYYSVRIVNPMMENSMDVFIFQKLEEKTFRIAEIWNTNGETNTFNLQEFNPSEIKKSLISDPVILAEMELMEDKERIQDEIRGVKNESERITKILEAKETFDAHIEDFEEWINKYRPAKGKEKRAFSTLLTLAGEIMKKQTDAEGKKMEWRNDRVYNKNIEYSDENPAVRPYYYYDVVFSNRTLQNSEKEYLGPRNLTIAKLPKYQKSLVGKIADLEKQMELAISPETIQRRADYIIAERLENKVETVSVADRVKEFEKLNYLLDHKLTKTIKTKPVALECPLKNEAGVLRIDKEAIEHLTKCLSDQTQTKLLHIDKEGEYTEGRKLLHKKLRAQFLHDVTCIKHNKPIAILTGGPPGAGKSHFLKNYAPYLLSKDIFHIDADEVRSKLPEYQGWNASATHFETKDIVDEMINHIGGTCKYDLVYDGTMNKAKKYYELINKLKAVGYDVYIIYLDIPQEISEKRVLDRYQRTGRFVPMDIVQEVFDAGHEALDQIKTMVTGYVIVDGLTGKVTSTGGQPIPKDRNYKALSETDNFMEAATQTNGVRSHKVKIAKAKASAQLQRIRILQIAKFNKGGMINPEYKKGYLVGDDTVYYVVRENDRNYTVVIDEKFDLWKKANKLDRFQYYEELVPKDEFIIEGPVKKEPWREYLDKQESFELGTPAVYHSVDFNRERSEESGEVTLNKEIYRDVYGTGRTYQPGTVKGISLYPDKNYSGSGTRFIIPNWNNVESFSENTKRKQKGHNFLLNLNKLEKGGMVNYPDFTNKKPEVINDGTLFEFDEEGQVKIANPKPAKTVREIELKLRNVDIPEMQVHNSMDINTFLRKIWNEDSINVQEEFYLLLLNRRNVIVSYQAFSKGGTAGTVVDKKVILAIAVKALAESVIIVHNHPSGSLVPSEADKKITLELKEALKLADIPLLDHLIIVPDKEKYFSFADTGLM